MSNSFAPEARLVRFVSGIALIAVLTALYFLARPRALFPNSDFEHGDLSHWKAEGEAFRYQPTLGNNVMARQPQRMDIQGLYWIGTYDARPDAKTPPGSVQGDPPVGKLTSEEFTVRGGCIRFGVSGGNDNPLESVNLVVDGETVLTENGKSIHVRSENLRSVRWDVSRYLNKKARIVIRDEDTTGWAHINADDFRYC